jgi:hypothetical protein
MGSQSDKRYWLDRWWLVLLIAFGAGCVLLVALWHPMAGAGS